jgi:hypothetical protein
MKKLLVLVCFIVFVQFGSHAQELQWKAGLNYFFDNTEYAKSTLTRDQTMTGVHFSPEIGVRWDSVHAIFAGVDVLKTAGSQQFIDKVSPIAYYRFQKKNSTFFAGAFPRSELLSNYSDLFFQDSVNYYVSTIQGLFWEVKKENSFFNLWLDWNGHQTPANRETFFIGTSAYKKTGILFADFQSYLFHFANTRPRTPEFNVCDNLLAQLSVGANYSNQSGLDTLLFSVGVLAGYERDRGLANGTHTPIGAVVRLNAEYYGFGTQNTLYAGQDRNIFYSKYNTGMYWNNPFLRSGFYVQSKWYLNFIRSANVNGRIGLNLHFSEGKIMYEQVLTLKAMLDNSQKPKHKPRPTLIDKYQQQTSNFQTLYIML